jgi:uncharacterized protein (TIGR03118 family)
MQTSLLQKLPLRIATLATVVCLSATAQSFKVTNIISDGSVPATLTDSSFINPWGLSPTSTWWINTQATGFSYAVATTPAIAFKVVVPTAAAPNTAAGIPSGIATTGGAVGMLLSNATKASFLFATLDGTISGWNSKLGTVGPPTPISLVAINNSASGASYTGLAVLNLATAGTTTASFILAPNFASGKIEVYDSTFAATKLTGSFTDPTLPAGYSPFSVHVIGTQVFVAYALKGSNGRATVAPGDGIVSIFDNAGNFVSRAVTGGNLNAPWGVAIAPASFGIFSNDLLIGNFGDGIINAYDPKTFAFMGQLMDVNGKALAYPSLWELMPGGTTVTGTTAVAGGDPSTVYFTSGLTANEAHGLFAGIANTVTAGSTPTFGFSASAGAATVTAGTSTQATLSIAPANGFSGTVTLACTNMPAGASCSFSPTTLTASATAVTTGTVTILTSRAMAGEHTASQTTKATGIAAAMLLPFASFLAFRRRKLATRRALQLLSLLLLFAAANGLLLGCADTSPATTIVTPAGTSNVTITATSGAVTQSTTMALTVQ